ncbi:uncharacterized protein LOC131955120 [Physella acuta]|uniref:uncharacterized protein LOC131955120 n=1 Tax=Physella acuta TaxID=109671 RepID=UPI0027DBB561|nr:uncharacterized protein LOC131955120 [Physella acuta]
MVILQDLQVQNSFHQAGQLDDLELPTYSPTQEHFVQIANRNAQRATGINGTAPLASAMEDRYSINDIINSKNEEITSRNCESGRSKFKLGSSKSWFNKSFDQTILNPPTEAVQHKTIRRQNSVTDFFQNMISKSRSHIQDMFSLKREKTKRKTAAGGTQRRNPTPEIGAEGGAGDISSEFAVHCDVMQISLHNSCPSFCSDAVEDFPARSRVSLNPDPSWRRNDKRAPSPSSITSPDDLFFIHDHENVKVTNEDTKIQHIPIVMNSGLFSTGNPPIRKSPTQFRRKSLHSPLIPPIPYRAPTIITTASNDSSESADDNDVVHALLGSRSSFLTAEMTHKNKRALVKSNSDTFTKTNPSPQLLAKASSDGNCSTKSLSSSLASSLTSNSNVMIAVTDYLFLGSIEAAYNEPLLCKYGISSLIDMTNTNPSSVPPHKKSDCPCACVNKTHFRSKLNIGVDDIEWENLEQYFGEINAFINGARKMGRHVLVFSYMGKSRAPAAVIQHLMQTFHMPYRDALNVVRANRPQVKLNSGFVKTLRRLEKGLGLQGQETDLNGKQLREESPRVSCGSIEGIETLNVPPVVRGAWLEC